MTPSKSEDENIEEEIDKAETNRRMKAQIGEEKGVAATEIVEEMEQSFIDYAMSVIVDRALPSVEDGLKPVHRRILYAMHRLGLDASKSTRKSATVVGEVMGKYHPHGDAAIYDTMVRLAQDFSLRYPLVHGQGNFGSLDGDPAAASRYTEAKLSKIADELLADIDKDSVNMLPNFDNSEKEPETMPAKLPNLLLNGATGIAVGMATNIPPHNLTELSDAIIEYINKPSVTIDELSEIVKGPDFPTGGIITGAGIKDMYKSGKGKIIIRARTSIEDRKGRPAIIVTEIPYMVNKADLVKNIARLATEKKLPDVYDLRDESAKGKVHIVIELKKDVDPKFTLNTLYKLTNLQTSFDANLLALVGKQPRILNLKDIILEYVKYRQVVVRRRSNFELKKAEDRIEIVAGLLHALKDIDRVVEFIKKSENSTAAHDGLMKKFEMTDRQAKAVLEIRLQQLTHLEADKLRDEEKKLKEIISELKSILGDEKEILKVIKKEIQEIKSKYGDERRTKIIKSIGEITEKDLIEKKDVVVMVTNAGYIKRVDVKSYREQKRGGAGVSGADLKEEDFVKRMLSCSTHDYLLFFTNRGRVYWLKANDVPASERQGKGKALINVLNLRDEQISNVISVKNFEQGYLFFATKLGIVKKMPLSMVSNPRSTGVRIMNLPMDGSDTVINVRIVADKQEVMVVTKKGQAIRFNSDEVRPMGRASYGVKGAELTKNDEVVSLISIPLDGKTTILTIGNKGYGKRSELEEFRKTSRGAKGVIAMETSDKTGDMISALNVDSKDSIIATTTKGMTLRTSMNDIRVMGRATQGVRVVNLKEGDRVADVVRVPREEGIIDAPEAQGTLDGSE
jgi:DNA gyrase subunit A